MHSALFVGIGALLDAELAGSNRIVDLNTGYDVFLREAGDARWRQIADAALSPDMLGFLEGGRAMDRARQVVDFAANGRSDPEGGQLIFQRDQVKLLAPVPRPRTMRDFSVYEEHMMRRRPDAQRPGSLVPLRHLLQGQPRHGLRPGRPDALA